MAFFTEAYATIKGLGADVIAISADTLDSHQAFCRALERCPFPLASDPDLKVARAFGVVGEGERRARWAVFVLDEVGKIVHAVPWYQSGNFGQSMGVLEALGLR